MKRLFNYIKYEILGLTPCRKCKRLSKYKHYCHVTHTYPKGVAECPKFTPKDND